MTVRGGANDVFAARNTGDYAHLVCHGSRRRRQTGSSRRPRLLCAARSYAVAAKGLRRGRHPGGGGGDAEAHAGDHGLAVHAVQLVQRWLQDLVEHPPDGGRHHEEQQLATVVAPGVRRHVRHTLRPAPRPTTPATRRRCPRAPRQPQVW